MQQFKIGVTRFDIATMPEIVAGGGSSDCSLHKARWRAFRLLIR
jgi:hypothetical protein